MKDGCCARPRLSLGKEGGERAGCFFLVGLVFPFAFTLRSGFDDAGFFFLEAVMLALLGLLEEDALWVCWLLEREARPVTSISDAGQLGMGRGARSA